LLQGADVNAIPYVFGRKGVTEFVKEEPLAVRSRVAVTKPDLAVPEARGETKLDEERLISIGTLQHSGDLFRPVDGADDFEVTRPVASLDESLETVPFKELQNDDKPVIVRACGQAVIEEVSHELQEVATIYFVDIGLSIEVAKVKVQGGAVSSEGAQAAVLSDVIKILVDCQVHRQTHRFLNCRYCRFGKRQQTSFNCAEFNQFGASGRQYEVKALDRLSAEPALFIPFEVVAAFGMVLILACNPFEVADNLAVALDYPGEWLLTIHLHHLDDVDPISV
jgi:hypothetical protein